MAGEKGGSLGGPLCADVWRGTGNPGRPGVSKELELQEWTVAGGAVGATGRLLVRPGQSAELGCLREHGTSRVHSY